MSRPRDMNGRGWGHYVSLLMSRHHQVASRLSRRIIRPTRVSYRPGRVHPSLSAPKVLIYEETCRAYHCLIVCNRYTISYTMTPREERSKPRKKYRPASDEMSGRWIVLVKINVTHGNQGLQITALAYTMSRSHLSTHTLGRMGTRSI